MLSPSNFRYAQNSTKAVTVRLYTQKPFASEKGLETAGKHLFTRQKSVETAASRRISRLLAAGQVTLHAESPPRVSFFFANDANKNLTVVRGGAP